MKTAIFLLDGLFQKAEAAARRLQVSRFPKDQGEDSITDRLNDLYSRHIAKVDSGLNRAQLKSLPKEGSR